MMLQQNLEREVLPGCASCSYTVHSTATAHTAQQMLKRSACPDPVGVMSPVLRRAVEFHAIPTSVAVR